MHSSYNYILNKVTLTYCMDGCGQSIYTYMTTYTINKVHVNMF